MTVEKVTFRQPKGLLGTCCAYCRKPFKQSGIRAYDHVAFVHGYDRDTGEWRYSLIFHDICWARRNQDSGHSSGSETSKED